MAENIVNPVGWTPASVLMNSTGDAMDNIFDIIVGWPWAEPTLNGGVVFEQGEAAASYRASGIDIPEPKTKTYSVNWHGIKVNKVAAGIDLDRQLKITYRLDANYALYQKWRAWQKLTQDVNTSGVANTASALGIIQVIAPGAEYNSLSWAPPAPEQSASKNMILSSLKGTTNLVWTFEDVQVVNVSTPKFQNKDSGTAMTYDVTAIFGDVAYPFQTSAGAVTHSHKSTEDN